MAKTPQPTMRSVFDGIEHNGEHYGTEYTCQSFNITHADGETTMHLNKVTHITVINGTETATMELANEPDIVTAAQTDHLSHTPAT